ncbi:MAG: HD family phosphohydrolase [Candidatus Limimorpha sp.]
MNKVRKIVDKIRHSYYGAMKAVAFIIALVVVVLLMPRNAKFKYEFQKMRPWQHESLYAPFNFPIYKSSEQVLAEEEKALEKVNPCFVFDVEGTEVGRENLLKDLDEQWNKDYGSKNYFRNLALEIFNDIENVGIVAKSDKILKIKPDQTVSVVRNKVISDCLFKDFYTMSTAHDYVREKLADIKNIDLMMMIDNVIQSSLRQNVVYSDNLTKQAAKKALDNILPTFGMVQKDELIIAEGEIVTEEKYVVLMSLQREYSELTSSHVLSMNYIFYGQVLLVGMVLIALFLILKMLRPDVCEELRYINLILLLMLLMIVPSLLLLKYAPSLIYLMPIAMVSMLLMTFFDARVSIVVQIMSLIIISLSMPNPFQYLFVQLFVSFVAIFSMNKRTNRSDYFGTSLSVFVTYLVVYLGMMLIYDGGFDGFRWIDVVIYAGNAILTMLALPLAFFVERVFGFVTDLTLLELSNSNSPLLRKLASDAPGTFQHVMQVADLCEEVIFNIGGNALLVRTGAMYHDIGKTKNPYYFIENQNGKYNPHEDISSMESAQIIISHVIDGIEICRQNHIPEQVIDFVRTHHGTRRTEFFYQMELRENPDLVDDSEFKYHGPIPFSKETAVLMMCDAVEAASRSLKDKTEESLSNLVDNIIDGQIKANQFDNTDITFRDITLAKKVIKKKLISIYHVRIEYPK